MLNPSLGKREVTESMVHRMLLLTIALRSVRKGGISYHPKVAWWWGESRPMESDPRVQNPIAGWGSRSKVGWHYFTRAALPVPWLCVMVQTTFLISLRALWLPDVSLPMLWKRTIGWGFCTTHAPACGHRVKETAIVAICCTVDLDACARNSNTFYMKEVDHEGIHCCAQHVKLEELQPKEEAPLHPLASV